MNRTESAFSPLRRSGLQLAMVLLLAGPPLAVEAAPAAASRSGEYNVVEFGAVGDGQTLNTAAIQKAIDIAAAAGGGRVLIPTGRFVTGTIILKSHVDLHLSQGAFLLGSTNVVDYPGIRTQGHRARHTNSENQQLIYAEKQTNISITGLGTIDGRGGAFQNRKNMNPTESFTRPFIFNIRFIQCEHVHVSDVTLRDSGAWMQQYLACNYVTIRGIKIFNHCNTNNDLIDIDSSSNVTISDLIGSSEDDGITLKSTGLEVSENIAIVNCVIHSNVNAIKFGTETTGGFRNVVVSNCVIHRKKVQSKHIHGLPNGDNICGIALMITDGGTMENIRFSNLVIEGAWGPFHITLGNRALPYHPDAKVQGVGTVRDIVLTHITAINSWDFMSHIDGLPGNPVRGVTISDFRIETQGGKPLSDFHKEVPLKPKSYPGMMMYGPGPAYGIFIRHAEDIVLRDIKLTAKTPDMRPGIIVDQSSKIELDNLDIQCFPGNETAVALVDSQDVEIKDCEVTGQTKAFLQVSGKESKDVFLRGIRNRNIGQMLELTDDARREQISIHE